MWNKGYNGAPKIAGVVVVWWRWRGLYSSRYKLVKSAEIKFCIDYRLYTRLISCGILNDKMNSAGKK